MPGPTLIRSVSTSAGRASCSVPRDAWAACCSEPGDELMANVLVHAVRKIFRRLGFDVVRHHRTPLPPSDIDATAATTIRHVQPYTMTSPERLYALIQAVRYVSATAIPGDIVECGVWRGGSMMAVAHALKGVGETARGLFLYDTFTGMPTPSGRDERFDGEAASDLLVAATKSSPIWASASLEDVMTNLASTGYPMENVHFIRGKVEDTIPQKAPTGICLLRLDTDWYESTKHELTHLYPRLARNGILIIDDYGHWRGAKEATDEYFSESKPTPFLHRIDYTGRLVIKT